MNQTKEQSAFVLRIAPSGDKVPEALREDQIIIGWACAEGLLAPELEWGKFRAILEKAYYSDEPTHQKAGAAAGNMWRFIREMKSDDLVVVPYGGQFYVAKITGPATYDSAKVEDDSAYRRPVKWLNEKKPISRQMARSALISRMKTQATSAGATDLLEEIKECLSLAEKGQAPTFESDLQSRLIREVLSELRGGRMESFGFERLIQTVLLGLGAQEARIIPRSQDKGADLLAIFRVAGTFQQVIAVQAKHWKPEPPVGRKVVEHGISTSPAKRGGDSTPRGL
ncbi:MAG: restriction endonuclease [Verrucomicrobiota bacterium]